MRTVRAEGRVVLGPSDALSLWRDLSRWPGFVEGFAHTVEVSPDWPGEGSKVVWQSTPEGRGRVTEKVLESSPEMLRTRVAEEALLGEQVVSFRAPTEGEGAILSLELNYELERGGPLKGVSDVLFIRRALRDSLGRTVRRFAVEAEEEAGLR